MTLFMFSDRVMLIAKIIMIDDNDCDYCDYSHCYHYHYYFNCYNNHQYYLYHCQFNHDDYYYHRKMMILFIIYLYLDDKDNVGYYHDKDNKREIDTILPS